MSRSPNQKTLSLSGFALSRDNRSKAQKWVCFHISTLNKQAKPREPPKLDPPNLWAYITDEEAARQKPHLSWPGPTQPQSQGQATQHTFDCRQQTGRRSAFRKKKKKASTGTRGLARVNSSAFYTVNTRQTSAQRCRRDYREDLRHLGIYPQVPHFDLTPLSI